MLEGLEPPKNRIFTCKVDLLKETLEEADYKILLQAINDKNRWPAKTLQAALRERGLSLADTTISKHRQQVCACYRDKLK